MKCPSNYRHHDAKRSVRGLRAGRRRGQADTPIAASAAALSAACQRADHGTRAAAPVRLNAVIMNSGPPLSLSKQIASVKPYVAIRVAKQIARQLRSNNLVVVSADQERGDAHGARVQRCGCRRQSRRKIIIEAEVRYLEANNRTAAACSRRKLQSQIILSRS